MSKVKGPFSESRRWTGFRVDSNEEDNQIRIVFFNRDERVVAWSILKGPEAYHFGKYILHEYDKLEGLA